MVCSGNGRSAPPPPLATDPPQRALRDPGARSDLPVNAASAGGGGAVTAPAGPTHPTQVPQAGHGDPQEVDSVLGPLQMMAVDLPPDGGARARVLAEVDQLRGGGRVRVLDMALMTRGPDGDIMLSAFGADAARR